MKNYILNSPTLWAIGVLAIEGICLISFYH